MGKTVLKQIKLKDFFTDKMVHIYWFALCLFYQSATSVHFSIYPAFQMDNNIIWIYTQICSQTFHR